MIKKTITYTNYNGMEVTEDFYFNLTSPELTKMTVRLGGDLEKYVAKLQQDRDDVAMIDFIEDLLLTSYGVKSKDGKRFEKGKDIRHEFEYSAAYAELFEELMMNPDSANKFGAGLVQGAKQQDNGKAAMIQDYQQRKEAEPTNE